MKERTILEYLLTFGVDKNFFDHFKKSSIEYMGGDIGFKSKNRGLLSRFKKQFIPLAEVFPANKKIEISLNMFDASDYINIYGIGEPMEVEKNLNNALKKISNLIHEKIKNKVTKGMNYEEAFMKEAHGAICEEKDIFSDYEEIFEKKNIFTIDIEHGIVHPDHEEIDFMLHIPEERKKYDGQPEFFNMIFSKLREAHFLHPYKKSKNRLLENEYFYLRYEKYSFLFSLRALCDTNVTYIKIL